MEIYTIPCGTLKVKATEMISPLTVKQIRKMYPVNEEGDMQLAMNALLVIESSRVVIFDPGCADFLPRRLSEYYGLVTGEPIEEKLEGLGVIPDQVTDVIFTHLHFDHGSGAFRRVPGRIEKRFPGARYHLLKEHFEYALKPDRKEASSFFTKFFRYIDRIHWLEDWKEEWIRFRSFYGHTYGMVVPVIFSPDVTTCYLTDLLPMRIFLEKEVFSGYDLNPELALKEKETFLNGLSGSNRLIYFHDPLESNTIYP